MKIDFKMTGSEESDTVNKLGSFCLMHSKPKRWDTEVYCKEGVDS